MSENTAKFVGFGFWNDHEGSFLLMELALESLRSNMEDAKKMFEENLDLFCVEFLAPDPVEIEPDDDGFDISSGELIPYTGFKYTEIYYHNPRYSKYRIYRHDSVSFITHPKHWDATLSFYVGDVLN